MQRERDLGRDPLHEPASGARCNQAREGSRVAVTACGRTGAAAIRLRRIGALAAAGWLGVAACGHDRLYFIGGYSDDPTQPTACWSPQCEGGVSRTVPDDELDEDPVPGDDPSPTNDPSSNPWTPGPDDGACVSSPEAVEAATEEVNGAARSFWSPNGEVREVNLYDCISPQVCGEPLALRILAVASNEALDSTGSGDGIVEVGCESVLLRAERDGDQGDRVYAIHFQASDALGNSAEGVCYTVVRHDNGQNTRVVMNETIRVEGPATCPET